MSGGITCWRASGRAPPLVDGAAFTTHLQVVALNTDPARLARERNVYDIAAQERVQISRALPATSARRASPSRSRDHEIAAFLEIFQAASGCVEANRACE